MLVPEPPPPLPRHFHAISTTSISRLLSKQDPSASMCHALSSCVYCREIKRLIQNMYYITVQWRKKSTTPAFSHTVVIDCPKWAHKEKHQNPENSYKNRTYLALEKCGCCLFAFAAVLFILGHLVIKIVQGCCDICPFILLQMYIKPSVLVHWTECGFLDKVFLVAVDNIVC